MFSKIRSVEINSSVPWDVDETLYEAFDKAQKGGKSLKIRLAPTLYVAEEDASGARVALKGKYVAWKNVAWNAQIESLEEGQKLRTGLQLFFRAIATLGVGEVVSRLQVMLREAPAVELAPIQDEHED